jgi:F-type H+-transporting ATPase subunit delta
VRANTVARSYAEALFELGRRTDAHQEFASSLHMLETLLQDDARVRTFLFTPQLDAATKKQVLRTALGGRVHAHFLNFLMIVLDKRRHRILTEIAQEYRALLDAQLGLLNVEVTLAHEPDERAEEELTAELTRILGRKVVPHIRVDAAILGGIIVRYADRLLDGSLRRKLMRLRARMLETNVA